MLKNNSPLVFAATVLLFLSSLSLSAASGPGAVSLRAASDSPEAAARLFDGHVAGIDQEFGFSFAEQSRFSPASAVPAPSPAAGPAGGSGGQGSSGAATGGPGPSAAGNGVAPAGSTAAGFSSLEHHTASAAETRTGLSSTGAAYGSGAAASRKQTAESEPGLAAGQAAKIAMAVLKKNTFDVELPGIGTRRVLTAGSDHFKTLWTRDACFGMLGLIEDPAGRQVVRDTLQSFFDRAGGSGQLPRRMGDRGNPTLMVYSFFGIKTPDPKKLSTTEYINELNVPQYDATILPIILALEYYKAGGDRAFIETNYTALKQAAKWLEASDSRLIDQPGGADWKDVLKRSGEVAYTNVLLYKAFASMAELNALMGEDVSHNKEYAEKLKREINTRIWDDKLGYYKDSAGVSAFSADGNMLALIWGVADAEKSAKVFAKLEYLLDNGPLPFPALEGEYSAANVPFWLKLAGMRHYHDKCIWPWQGNVLAVAAARAGKRDLAMKAINKVAAQAVKDGTFYEVYENKNGKVAPVRSLFYRSEPDFTWSAGTFLWAAREINAAFGGN